MKKILILLSVGILLLTTTACGGKSQPTSNPTTTETVETKQTVDAFGTVAVTDIKDISIDFNANVEKVSVKEGQNIKMGDSLITLDISEYQELIKAKESDIESARLDLQKEISDINMLIKNRDAKKALLKNDTDPDIKKLLNDYDVAAKDYTDATGKLTQKERLYQSNSISKDELDEFKKTVDSKNDIVKSIKLSIESMRYTKQNEIEQLQQTIDQKNVASSKGFTNAKLLSDKVAALENELKMMKDKLNRSDIKQNELVSDVPNGIAYDIGYVTGGKIVPGNKILSIMNLDSIVIKADVAEEFIKDVKVGADATIIPQADKSKTYKGKVISISSKAVQKNGVTEIPVLISIENKDGFLLPDFNVDVKINTVK